MARNRKNRNRQSQVQEEQVEITQEETQEVEEQEEVTETNIDENQEENIQAEVPEELEEEVTPDTILKEKIEENTEPKELTTEEVVKTYEEKQVETKVTQPTPTVNEVKPKINIENKKLNLQDVQRVLKDRNLTVEEKLMLIAKNGNTEFKSIAAALTTYNKTVGKEAGMVYVKLVASKNQVLLNTLKKVLEVKGENAETKFKVMFDIINLGFLHYRKDAFNIFNLHRGTEYWNDSKDLNTYNLLTFIISELCALASRKNKSKDLDFNKALKLKEVSLSERAINRIKAYYRT